jgi:hypothetical protein
MKNNFKLLVIPDKPFPMPPLREIETHYITDTSMPFIEALITLRRRAKYHEFKLTSCLNDPLIESLHNQFKMGAPIETISKYMERMSDLAEIIDAELVAMMQALHSQFDIFAQIINAELFYNPLPPRKVSFIEINSHLKEFPMLKQAVEKVKGDTNFNYLNDFVNTNKHIYVPGVKWDQEEGELRFMDSVAIESFQRKKSSYASKKLNTISFELKPWVDAVLRTLSLSMKEYQTEILDARKS